MSPRCSDGGWCIDDLCYGTSRTLCGLEESIDFCHHDQTPTSCQDCRDEDDGYTCFGPEGTCATEHVAPCPLAALDTGRDER